MRHSYFTIIAATAFLFIFFSACTKKETIYIDRPGTCFKMYSQAYQTDTVFVQQNKALRNHSVVFKNCTTYSDSVTYRWDFGDGEQSSGKDARHYYGKKGVFRVLLTVLKDGIPIDTLSQPIRIYAGQQNIAFLDEEVYPLDITETRDKGYLILGKSYPTKWPYLQKPATYFLHKLDSLMVARWSRDFKEPVSFSSIEPLADGGYILTGNTQGVTGKFSLTKVDSVGEVVWSKVYNNTNKANSYAVGTKDNGIVTIGNKEMLDQYGVNKWEYTYIIKTDQQGNVLWEKDYKGPLTINYGMNIIAEDDGYVFAANQHNFTCSLCDSALIMKINPANGQPIWSGTKLWGYNIDNRENRTYVAKTGNEYRVFGNIANGLITFSAGGNFINRNLYNFTYGAVSRIAPSTDGDVFFLNNDWPSRQVAVYKVSSTGEVLWDRRFKVIHEACCSMDLPIAIKPLASGGCIVLGAHDTFPSQPKMMVVALDKNGDEL